MSSGQQRLDGGDLLAGGRLDVAGDVVDEFGVDGAGLDHADPHPVADQFLPQRLGEGVDAELRQVVDAAAGPRHPPGGGADVDHVGHPPGRAARRRDQVRQRRVGDVQQRLHVERDHPIPLVGRRPQRRAEQHHARVVDHGVQPAEPLGDLLHGGDRLLLIGHVGLDDVRAPAALLDGAGELGQPVEATGHQPDGRALGRQPPGRRRADPLLAPVTSAAVPARGWLIGPPPRSSG